MESVKRRYTQFLRIDLMAESIEEANKIIANELKGRENVSYVQNAFENEIKTTTKCKPTTLQSPR